ncbi:MAG: ATP-binding protein, partial [Acidobacteriota bacterium]
MHELLRRQIDLHLGGREDRLPEAFLDAVDRAYRDADAERGHLQRAKEKDAEELQRQVHQAQKMEAVGRLAGGIAHDFNNMLVVIRGYCDLCLAQFAPDAPLRGHVHEISKAAGRAADLTRQLLAYSRQQVLEPRLLDLNEVVADLDGMLARVLGEHVDLVLELGATPSLVRADRGQLQQVLMNLVINARDAMPEGGRIDLATENLWIDEAFASDFDYPVPLGPKVLVRVKDTGTGIPPERLGRIFEPFFTTKDVGRGTGLGLSTAYGIVKQSGGYIWVDSAVGEGTEFRVCLPQASGAAVAEESQGSEGGARLRPAGGVVLVTEDDLSVRSVIVRLLRAAGYEVHEADSPAVALGLQAQGQRFDLLITDIVMPEMDGNELARRLTEGQPDLQILYISGYNPEAYERQGMLRPGEHFLQKPF